MMEGVRNGHEQYGMWAVLKINPSQRVCEGFILFHLFPPHPLLEGSAVGVLAQGGPTHLAVDE